MQAANKRNIIKHHHSRCAGTLSLSTWLWLDICLRLYNRRVASVQMAAMSSLRPSGRPKNLIFVRPFGGIEATPGCQDAAVKALVCLSLSLSPPTPTPFKTPTHKCKMPSPPWGTRFRTPLRGAGPCGASLPGLMHPRHRPARLLLLLLPLPLRRPRPPCLRAWEPRHVRAHPSGLAGSPVRDRATGRRRAGRAALGSRLWPLLGWWCLQQHSLLRACCWCWRWSCWRGWLGSELRWCSWRCGGRRARWLRMA